MVATIITENMIDIGHQITDLLDRANLEIEASLWSYDEESNRWYLVIASPLVGTWGPMRFYKEISRHLTTGNYRSDVVGLANIKAVTPSHPLISLLKSISPRDKVQDVHLRDLRINNTLIDDVYIITLRN